LTAPNPLYLEFGVWEGWSLALVGGAPRQAGRALRRLRQLPGTAEEWRPDYPPGFFATASPPSITDPRVSVPVGWFDETLADFELPAQ